MVVPIYINQEDILSQFNMSQREVEGVIDSTIKEITASFASAWENEANSTLKSTRERYINNLKVIDEGRMQGAVVLDYSKDKLVKMIEEGCSPFDLKNGFSNSDKKHITKSGGWYLTIPFSFGAPDSSMVSGFANILPSSVHQIVKQQPVNPETNRSAGLSKSEIPSEFAIPKVRAAIVIPESTAFKEYQQKHSIYEGVFKSKDSVMGQNTYGSFRRVSDKSDENSWIHPGMEEGNFAEKAFGKFETNMQTVLEDAMDSALSQFGFE